MIYCFFVLVVYPDPAQWTGAVLQNPCKIYIRLGREALVLGCNYHPSVSAFSPVLLRLWLVL